MQTLCSHIHVSSDSVVGESASLQAVKDGLERGGERHASDEPAAGDSADLKALRAFSKTFINHPQLDATIVPIGDGLGIGARID